MIRLVSLNFLLASGYFAIQHFAGWMIYMPGLQQGVILMYGLVTIGSINIMSGKETQVREVFLVPVLSLLILAVIYGSELGMIYFISVLNFIAYIISIYIASKLFIKYKLSNKGNGRNRGKA